MYSDFRGRGTCAVILGGGGVERMEGIGVDKYLCHMLTDLLGFGVDMNAQSVYNALSDVVLI